MKISALPIFLGLLSNALAEKEATGLVVSYAPGMVRTAVSVYNRFEDGSLEGPTETLSAGDGNTVSPVSSDKILTVGTTVFAVNRDANEVWAYDLSGESQLIDTADSGGLIPCSLAYSDGILYVLNGAWNEVGASVPGKPTIVFGEGTPTITAFSVVDGKLMPLPERTRVLDGYTDLGGAQIGVTPDGRWLLVAIQGALKSQPVFPLTPGMGSLLVYSLANGMLAEERILAVSGINWFTAFQTAEFFGQTYVYLESLIDGTVAPYRVEDDGSVTSLGPAVLGAAQGSDAFLSYLGRSGRYLYGTNFGISTITSWLINTTDGSLSLLEEVDGGSLALFNTTNFTGLVDVTTSDGVLYAVESVDYEIQQYMIEDDGQITFSGRTSGGAAASGLAVLALPTDATPAPTSSPTSSASAVSPHKVVAATILAIVGGLLL